VLLYSDRFGLASTAILLDCVGRKALVKVRGSPNLVNEGGVILILPSAQKTAGGFLLWNDLMKRDLTPFVNTRSLGGDIVYVDGGGCMP
jgi:hypothetical protein